MRKYGGAAIHMQTVFEQIEVRSGTKDLEKIKSVMPLKSFDETVCEFLSAVSDYIMQEDEAKQYTDVISFAFFCRNANISRFKERYAALPELCVGRGLVFHIAPGNVAVNFAYSLVSALLSGNASIIKISSKKFPQTDRIIDACNKVLSEGKFLKLVPYINIWFYPSEYEKITRQICASCDVRVIWGGNDTIDMIRKCPLPPRSFDVTFADRRSICLLNAEAVSDTKDIRTLIRKFYNDTYLTDQNACTSPFLIVWTGDNKAVRTAQNKFWGALSEYVAKNYDLKASVVADKYDKACQTAIAFRGKVRLLHQDNFIYRLELEEMDLRIADYRCHGGFFFEYVAEDLEFLKELADSRYQTLSYYGYEKKDFADFVKRTNLKGLDRIVPVGQTMDFDLVWDGYDLIYVLSRRVTIV